MAGILEDPSQWRLRTNTGIPFKFLGTSGEFSPEEGNVNWRVLIRSNQLIAFLTEIFPPSITIGNVSIPRTAPLPGLPSLAARRLTFKSFDESLPIDPFGFDPSASADTYFPVIELDVEFGPREVPDREPDQNNPFSFLEISGNTTGEFIHSTMPQSKWQPKTNPDLANADDDFEPDTGGDDEDDPSAWVDPGTNKPADGAVNPTLDATEVCKDPTVPCTILVPQTEWTLKWNQIDFAFFRDVLVHRLRILMGRVNYAPVPVLFNALPETLLFVGYNYSNQFTWREGNIGTPPVSLEIKIIEKRVVWKGVVRGHNDVWRPGTGWETLLIDGTNKMYRAWDYNGLFSLDQTPTQEV